MVVITCFFDKLESSKYKIKGLITLTGDPCYYCVRQGVDVVFIKQQPTTEKYSIRDERKYKRPLNKGSQVLCLTFNQIKGFKRSSVRQLEGSTPKQEM